MMLSFARNWRHARAIARHMLRDRGCAYITFLSTPRAAGPLKLRGPLFIISRSCVVTPVVVPSVQTYGAPHLADLHVYDYIFTPRRAASSGGDESSFLFNRSKTNKHAHVGYMISCDLFPFFLLPPLSLRFFLLVCISPRCSRDFRGRRNASGKYLVVDQQLRADWPGFRGLIVGDWAIGVGIVEARKLGLLCLIIAGVAER